MQKGKVVMNEMDPIILIFAMFFTSLLLVIAAVVVWGVTGLKRARLSCAATQLNDIVKLANETLRSGSKEQQSALNTRIDEWDKRFGKELGVEITRLAAA